MINWKKLQNGSDIRGVALDGVEGETVNLTPEVAEILGKAFVQWLKNTIRINELSVAVGTDSRISGPVLKAAFLKGMTEAGAKVFDCGIASTPAMFMTTVSGNQSITAGVMITASHLPFNRNGFKFFTSRGGLDKNDISKILGIAEEADYSTTNSVAPVSSWNFIDEYSSFLVNYIRKQANIQPNYERPLQGLKIIVDAGNGAGGFFASKVLDQLGADTRGSQFLDPDGNFPNHVPNPEDEEAMQSICDAVIRENADLGVIFDTDVDRSAIVDAKGNPVNRNALIALISAVILKEHPGSTIVTDSITSEGLTAFIEKELKGIHLRFKRGYKNVINESIRLNEEGEESWLAIETSGHAALKENYFLDDGAYLVAKLLVEMAKLNADGKNLTDLIEKLKQPNESKEFRFSISNDDFLSYGNRVLEELKEKVAQLNGWTIVEPNFEGVRVSCAAEKGWFLLRMSLHDPVMPLNIESDIQGGVEAIKNKLAELLNDFTGLDNSVLR
ncbi:phosphoglucomutase [Mangrovibacterium sp.]|uniref:phosphoglucomutase n=1 Tax=Mangrovibacterium sp. TaxID=1961364 RepID=UPI003566F715